MCIVDGILLKFFRVFSIFIQILMTSHPFNILQFQFFSMRLLFLALLFVCVSCQGRSGSGDSVTTARSIKFNYKVTAEAMDTLIFQQVMADFNTEEKLPGKDKVIAIAKYFLGTPYVASTLETGEEEHLVVNLRGMDCTTYVEYVLAILNCIELERTAMDDFYLSLANIRYRDGNIDGYLSRLHYFTEWLQENRRWGRIELVSDEFGNADFDATVGFMSANSRFYRQLTEQPGLLFPLRDVEARVSQFKMRYITKNRIDELSDHIQDGDIIAFTSSIAGLDVSHTGFALKQNGRLHLLHASTRTHQVEITPVPLSDYLAGMSRVTGILVARWVYDEERN